MIKQNIVVLFGGNSVEKDISIITALQVINALDKEKYNIIAVYMTSDYQFLINDEFSSIETFRKNVNGNRVYFINRGNKLYLEKDSFFKKRIEVDFVIPTVHGKNVEDGTIAGFLETLGVSYSSCNVLTSSIFQNKHITKVLLDYYKISNIEYIHITENAWVEKSNMCLKKIKKMGFPIIVKACSLGSSIGIFKVSNEEDLFWALNACFKYDKEIIIEKCLERYREFNQAIFGDCLSEIEEIKGMKDFLTFSNKYEGKDIEKVLCTNLGNELKEEINKITKKIAKNFQIKGVIRVDYLFDEEKNILYVNEINTIPGSLAFYLFKDDFSIILDKLIQEGIKSRYLDNLKISSFQSNILKNIDDIKK